MNIKITYGDGSEVIFHNAKLCQSSYTQNQYHGTLDLNFDYASHSSYKPFKFSDLDDII